MDYQFQWNVIWQNWRLFLAGVLLTIQIAFTATALGLVIGTTMAGLQLLKNRYISAVIQVYIEVIRNTPFLVQLFFVFFGLTTLGIKIPASQAALLALTINIGAYATEIVRAGIESISVGQIEAGRSLGLSGLQIFLYVILKPALITVYPALTSQFILIMLNSAVISVISARELAYQAKYHPVAHLPQFRNLFLCNPSLSWAGLPVPLHLQHDLQSCVRESSGTHAMREFNFNEVLTTLLLATWWTIILSIVALIGGGILGMLLTMMRISKNRIPQDGEPVLHRIHPGHTAADAAVHHLLRNSDRAGLRCSGSAFRRHCAHPVLRRLPGGYLARQRGIRSPRRSGKPVHRWA